ncbi:TFIIB-type zinc ribbon-containing protein [Brachybacterium halotolerans subsp. kimchii]|uniref:TFIIB-type zinc ribbon-containing protein n=1 Tax=Brachybacterium halotolerans TaxID=2795215 RepID=UPI001E2E27B3|nr:TFIIB-type zinc ribbon-containing protein [Brachybacterium halotolerans]UEJ81989.1 TFIIB-type zinc ribbon-containing protein [Brachybacterium halotolerans subsp. kimchii]
MPPPQPAPEQMPPQSVPQQVTPQQAPQSPSAHAQATAPASTQPPSPTQPGSPGQPGGPAQPADPADPAEQVRDVIDEATSGDRIIDTDRGKSHGLDKCPRCGSSDVHYRIESRSLVCDYCRNQWNEGNAEKAFHLDTPIQELRGENVASGAQDVQAGESMVTIKCQGCGAEVVVKSDETLQARCHWCRQVLSINHQIPNGAVPDAVLPFTLTREQAVEQIKTFVDSRRTFANRTFVKEFVPDNVKGVYMPYMVVDGNLHTDLRGTGEITTRTYTVQRRVGKDQTVSERYWDASVHELGRSFDVLVNDLTAGSSRQYDRTDSSAATNYILDAVQPYDTREALVFNPNYLSGFTSERRDLDIDDLDERVEDKFLTIAREKARPTIAQYDRGVRWEREGVAIRGTRWITMYVPVWLYSYYQQTSKGSYVHYIAVNGRTGKTMGSVPVSHPRIFSLACAGGAVATAAAAVVGWGVFLTRGF